MPCSNIIVLSQSPKVLSLVPTAACGLRNRPPNERRNGRLAVQGAIVLQTARLSQAAAIPDDGCTQPTLSERQLERKNLPIDSSTTVPSIGGMIQNVAFLRGLEVPLRASERL